MAVPSGAQAYDAIPVQAHANDAAIQPGDRLSIIVLGEDALTSDKYWVDGAGTLIVPLAGDINTKGLTTSQVRAEITRRLGARYIRDPQVAISIVEHAKSTVTVEGEVKKAGRFEASPGLTLLGALALAESTSINARNSEVYVFRTLDGQRLVARFDISKVRRGQAPDPEIIAGDKVIVARSTPKSVWHDLLQAAPLFNIFYVFK